MKLICKPNKPRFDNTNVFCDFRTSKAYLWGLINHLLASHIDSSENSRNSVLDAACHALITRSMFPDGYNYYGLDVSSKRLQSAFKIKSDQDVLLRADLTRKFTISHCFDVVVSCNTLSHLSFSQQRTALDNLLSLVVPRGKLFINMAIDEHMMTHCSVLLSAFESVEAIYFDSFRSSIAEFSSKVNKSNVADLLVDYEFCLPNQACLHRQVLFICNSFVGKNRNSLPEFSRSSITTISSLPSVSHLTFPDDAQMLRELSSSVTQLLITSKLFSSPYFNSLQASLDKHGYQYDVLDGNSVPANSTLAVLGLENEWSSDVSLDRTFVNLLREIPDTNLILASVSRRDGLVCTPSLVLSDP